MNCSLMQEWIKRRHTALLKISEREKSIAGDGMIKQFPVRRLLKQLFREFGVKRRFAYAFESVIINVGE